MLSFWIWFWFDLWICAPKLHPGNVAFLLKHITALGIRDRAMMVQPHSLHNHNLIRSLVQH